MTTTTKLEHIRDRDPDGGSRMPTDEDYKRFEQWVRDTYGEQAWLDYKGWGRDEDAAYQPWAEG